MKTLIRSLSLVFASGVFGALASGAMLWVLGKAGIPADLGVKLAAALTPAWLFPRLVWGGLWGFLFLLPIARSHPFRQGLILSLAPTLFQLLLVFPYRTKAGMLGLDLGLLTPVFVLFLNALWGVAAALWLKASQR